MMIDDIQEYPYKGTISRIIVGEGDDDDTTTMIYDGVMDETMQRDNEGKVLQTSAYVVSIPLTKDDSFSSILDRLPFLSIFTMP